MSNLTTFDNRVGIQFTSINSDIRRFSTIFEGDDAHYILLALSFIFSILIVAGRIIEINNLVLEDGRILQIIILGKIVWWLFKSFLGKKL